MLSASLIIQILIVTLLILSSPGSGASTYTLDSGIGTFPLPDCSSGATGRGLSRARAGGEHHSSGSPGRAGRRARTLDRELTSQEECYSQHKQLIPTIQYSGSMMEGRSSASVIHEGDEKLRQHRTNNTSKNTAILFLFLL